MAGGGRRQTRSFFSRHPPPTNGPTPAASVKLEVVKHKQFLEALGKQRGKVVVIDLWGEF